MMITRRTLFGMLAAPAVIRVADLMPVRTVLWTPPPVEWERSFLSVHQIHDIVKALKEHASAAVPYRGEMVYLQYREDPLFNDDPRSNLGCFSWKTNVGGKQWGGATRCFPYACDERLFDMVVDTTDDIDWLHEDQA